MGRIQSNHFCFNLSRYESFWYMKIKEFLKEEDVFQSKIKPEYYISLGLMDVENMIKRKKKRRKSEVKKFPYRLLSNIFHFLMFLESHSRADKAYKSCVLEIEKEVEEDEFFFDDDENFSPKQKEIAIAQVDMFNKITKDLKFDQQKKLCVEQ